MEKYSRLGNLVGVGLIVAGLALWALIMIKGPGMDDDPAAPGRVTGSVGNSGSEALPAGTLPAMVESGPADVRQAYEFVANSKNHEVLRAVTCYCGCTRGGHKNLLSCYVKEIKPGGKILYESHAMGCATCVSEALEAQDLMGAGKSKAQIKRLIDERYGAARPDIMLPDS